MDATEAAVHFAKSLQAAKIPHAIGGAIAYGFFGAARGTWDVDLNVFVAGDAAGPALSALVAAGLEIDEAGAVQSALERGDARGRYQGLPVDLFFNSIPAHERAALRTREVTLHGEQVRVLAPEDTCIFKMLFYRGKDVVDVERLLGLMGPLLDAQSVREALVEVVGTDDYRVKKWDELVTALR
jgi:hypothetical protein